MKGNTSVSGVLEIIKDQVSQGVTRNDCHGHVSKAIIKRNMGDDILVFLGINESVFHSILLSNNGEVIADSYNKNVEEYDIDNGSVTYTKNGMNFTLNIVYKVLVGDI